jgi:hypothetical protein
MVFRETGFGRLYAIVLVQQTVQWQILSRKYGKLGFETNVEYLIELIQGIFVRWTSFMDLYIKITTDNWKIISG